jgi:acetyl esterase/lipase
VDLHLSLNANFVDKRKLQNLQAAQRVCQTTAQIRIVTTEHEPMHITIPLESSERLFKQMREAKIAAELHAFDGVPHAFDSNPDFAKSAAQLADFFIDRHVLNPRTHPPFGGGGGRGAR